MSGILFIVSAPSGAGKTSLVSALVAADPRIAKSVSYTTRAPRAGETDGREYHFVTVAEFERMLARGEFLEHALVHGNRYGTSGRWVGEQLERGRDILLEIDWQGAAQVRKARPDAVGIFVLPPSLTALEARLRGRGLDSEETIAQRLANARGEISHCDEFDYVIINEDFSCAAQDLISIVRAERLRLSRQAARHADLINRMK
jgi:guanylate kinase